MGYDRPTLGLSSATPPEPERPQRRGSDSGLRALFTPKAFIVALLSVAGLGVSTGRWLDAREHNDTSLAGEIARVEQKADAAQKAAARDELDKRYVPREVYELDIAWIKRTLTEILVATRDPQPRRK